MPIAADAIKQAMKMMSEASIKTSTAASISLPQDPTTLGVDLGECSVEDVPTMPTALKAQVFSTMEIAAKAITR